jgi:hypothetical protein
MGLDLPPEVAGLFSAITGSTWPESDEESLFRLAGEWTSMADQLDPLIEQLNLAAATLPENNSGADIDAFQARWDGEEAAARNLAEAGNPSNVINIGLTVGAGLVLALKIQIIVQLVILAIQIAQAIAFAAVTFGASLAQIPIFKKIVGTIIEQLMDMAITRILNG